MYLGIILDEKLSFRQHPTEVAAKATAIFYKNRRGAKASWGLDFKALTILYKGIGDSILLYGAAVWIHRMTLATYANSLLRAQRMMLLTVCKGYRTLPKDV